MLEVIATDEFTEWYGDLDDAVAEDVTEAVDLLGRMGTALGYPHSSAIKGAKAPLRELRIQSKGKPIRVFYAFDPDRNAVLLVGGDKTGDGRFYKRLTREAERLWRAYLKERAAGLHRDEGDG
jgi:hypothetical protein